MQVHDTELDGVKIVEPDRHTDDRGWLSELWNPRALADAGLELAFVQDNLTHNPRAGSVRALHFQAPPREQGKLIVCITGAIYDVALDIRVGSPTYGRHVGIELRGDDPRQLWIPAGFAHGYCAIEAGSTVLYKMTAPYDGPATGGVMWNDPALGIDWPVAPGAEVAIERDRTWPTLAELESPFAWAG